MTTTDDPRMGEFDELLGDLLMAAQAVAVGEQSAAVAAERKRALRSWVAANLVPAPSGERAELVKRLREDADEWLIEEESRASLITTTVTVSGLANTVALLREAADALEAGLANSPTEPASSLASRVDQLAARVAELEDRVERLGDDSQEHHDRLWTLEDQTGSCRERLDGIDRELGEANRRAIAKAGDKNVPDSVTAEIDAALLALYLEGYREALMDHTQLDGWSLKPHLANEAYWRPIIAERDGWPARDRVRALLNERREG